MKIFNIIIILCALNLIVSITPVSGKDAPAAGEKKEGQKPAQEIMKTDKLKNILTNVKTEGSVDIRSLSHNNFTDRLNTNPTTGFSDDLIEQTLSRIVIGASGDFNKNISGKILLVKNDRLYGTAVQTVNGVLGLVKLENAYLDIKGKSGLNIRIGRQSLGEEGDMVMYFGSKNNTALSVTSADAINVDFLLAKLNVSILYSKLNENAAFFTDTDMVGFNVQSSELIPLTDAKAYFYNRTIQNPSSAILDSVGVLGFTARIKPSNNFLCKLEGAMNLGSGYTGNAVAFNASYNSELSPGKINAGFDMAFAKGDNQSTAKNEGFVDIASDKRYGEIIGKNIAGITNLEVEGLNADITPSKFADSKLKVGLAAFIFKIKTPPAGVPLTTDKTIGNEIDIKLSYEISENASFDLSYGVFLTARNSYYKALDGNTDNIEQVLATLNLKF